MCVLDEKKVFLRVCGAIMTKKKLFLIGLCLGLFGVNALGVYFINPALFPDYLTPVIYYVLMGFVVLLGFVFCFIASFFLKIHHTIADLLKIVFALLVIIGIVLFPSFLKNILATCFMLSLSYSALVLLLLISKSYGWRGHCDK